MLKAIIIDDEEMGRIALREKLNSYCPDIAVVGEAENGKKGIQLIKEKVPEVVFLDIEMPGMNGFEMLNQLRKEHHINTFHLVFTTAYDQYAIRAIRYAAFDYLLKPIDIDELKLTVLRIQKENSEDTPEKLNVLEVNLKTDFDKIAIPTVDSLLFFRIGDIVHLEAAGNYTTLYFINQPKIVASRTLKDFEELLPGSTFFRTHHSHIINLQYIKRYMKGEGGQIILENEQYVPVSRRKKDEFLSRINTL